MARNPDSTLPSRRVPSIVLVASAPELLAALQREVQRFGDAPNLKAADLESLTTIVAEWRPFAVIVAADVLAFDHREFRALARDVGAEVMVYEADTPVDQVVSLLLPDVEAALLMWMTSEFARA